MDPTTHTVAIEIRMLTSIIAKMAMRAMEQRLGVSGAGLSHLQFGILLALSCRERTISELSERFVLDPSTLVPAVDALERKGFLQRGRDPRDRRRVPLSLTPRGQAFVQKLPITDENDPLVQSLKAIGDEQAQQLLALLRELVRHMPRGQHILEQISARMQTYVAGVTQTPRP